MARVLVISFSDLGRDPRVDRQIGFLLPHHRIVAAGLGPPRHAVDEFVDISPPPRRLRERAVGLALSLARRYETHFWTRSSNIAALERLRHVRPDVVLANDIDTLPIALALQVPVVFDAHEHAPSQFAERRGWQALHATRIRWLCRRYLPRAAKITIVGQGIADAYERDFRVRATVVTNAPHYADLAPTPLHDPIRIVHHGGAQPGRGLEEMVQAAALLDERFTTDFMLVESWPGYRERLIRLAAGNPRIEFPDPQPMDMLVEATNDYDIGIFLLPPVNLQRRYALPNKLFEFIQARLAIAVGPSPEMASIVRTYGCGIVTDDFEPETLATALNGLDSAAIDAFKRASHAAARELCAEKNEPIVVAAVEEALGGGG
ncbi:MAG TPA: glycosyltransferase [Gaiellaceae bacterium]|nr:glycosyltransferase [Gaiellaceae bacterium]